MGGWGETAAENKGDDGMGVWQLIGAAWRFGYMGGQLHERMQLMSATPFLKPRATMLQIAMRTVGWFLSLAYLIDLGLQ